MGEMCAATKGVEMVGSINVVKRVRQIAASSWLGDLWTPSGLNPFHFISDLVRSCLIQHHADFLFSLLVCIARQLLRASTR